MADASAVPWQVGEEGPLGAVPPRVGCDSPPGNQPGFSGDMKGQNQQGGLEICQEILTVCLSNPEWPSRNLGAC